MTNTLIQISEVVVALVTTLISVAAKKFTYGIHTLSIIFCYSFTYFLSIYSSIMLLDTSHAISWLERRLCFMNHIGTSYLIFSAFAGILFILISYLLTVREIDRGDATTNTYSRIIGKRFLNLFEYVRILRWTVIIPITADPWHLEVMRRASLDPISMEPSTGMMDDFSRIMSDSLGDISILLNLSDKLSLFMIIIISSLVLVISSIISGANTINLLFSINLVFISSGLLFAAIGAEFLGLIMILIYSGAILVLFLYLVMVVDSPKFISRIFSYTKVLLISISIFLLYIIIEFFSSSASAIVFNGVDIITQPDNIHIFSTIGSLLYIERFLDVILLGIILLLGLFGTILIILRKSSVTRSREIFKGVINTLDSEIPEPFNYEKALASLRIWF